MPSLTAAHVAAVDRRLGMLAGPLGPVTAPSGDSPNGSAVQVELYVQGVWQDITSFVLTRDGSQKITITRGQPDENSQANAARCSFQLNNRDGRFTPKNPNGAYYGSIGRNTQIRVSVQSGNAKSYRFWGEVPAWPQRWDRTRTDVWVEAEAAGILRRLGQGSEPLKSVVYRALTSPTSANPPVAYWPCEDATGSTSIASALGGTPMAISGAPSLHSSSAFVASDSLPVMSTGAFSGGVPPYTATGQTQVRFLLLAPAAGSTDHTVLCRFTTSGTAQRWELYYTSGGGLGLRAFTLAGASVGDTGAVSFSIDGKLLQVSVGLTEAGGNVNFIISTVSPGALSAPVFSGTFNGATVGRVLQMFLAPNGDQPSAVMGHFSLQTVVTNIFDLSQQTAAWVGESAPSRISRLCLESNIPVGVALTNNDTAMGAQGIETLLSLLQECVAADLGTFFENRGSFGLGYRSRTFNYNQPPNVALDYSAFNLSEVPAPIDDDRFTRNDITVNRTGGSFARKTLDVGALSTLNPPAGVGRYDTAVTINVQADTDLPDQAAWRLHLGTVDEPRYNVIAVNLAHQSFVSNPTLREQVLALDMGWRMTVVNPPPELPPGTISALVLGVTEVIDHFQHRLTFNCAPESPYEVAVADDPVLGVADTDGSTLALDAQATDTTMTVATTNPTSPLWTTSAGDFPFDVVIGGERITVTNISGSVSPQTFTVTRSVNGIVKPQPAGSDVRLFQPAIAAL